MADLLARLLLIRWFPWAVKILSVLRTLYALRDQ
ncbi:unnamed protein product [Strongylus vulgaris]|uniref:Uncharacterized protein n=1 Tax=Strongylus vulgaris TaxID=40348 RepID=A0A3P7L8L8_STRVU|nr:unnamed protein product [Strongylus vulgaris]